MCARIARGLVFLPRQFLVFMHAAAHPTHSFHDGLGGNRRADIQLSADA